MNEEAREPPVLKGVEGWVCDGENMLYKHPGLSKETTVLLTGTIGKETQPVAWALEYDKDKGGRAFYSVFGIPCDFANKNFRTLMINGLFWTLKRDAPEAKAADEE